MQEEAPTGDDPRGCFASAGGGSPRRRRRLRLRLRTRLTTDQLIDAAVARGEISPEQGLTYKVFATFGDPRLPSKYKGVPDPVSEAPLDDVTAQWDQLSAGAKATLGPFLIPPFHQGSYWEQKIQGTRCGCDPLRGARLTPRRRGGSQLTVVRRQRGRRPR